MNSGSSASSRPSQVIDGLVRHLVGDQDVLHPEPAEQPRLSDGGHRDPRPRPRAVPPRAEAPSSSWRAGTGRPRAPCSTAPSWRCCAAGRSRPRARADSPAIRPRRRLQGGRVAGMARLPVAGGHRSPSPPPGSAGRAARGPGSVLHDGWSPHILDIATSEWTRCDSSPNAVRDIEHLSESWLERMTTIAFIGAGSVVFTRELLADLFALPRAADATHRPARHRPRAAGAPPRAIARHIADQRGAAPQDHRARPTAGPRSTAPTSSSTSSRSAGRRDPAPTSRSRPATGCGRRSATRSASAASSAALRTFPVLRGTRRGHRRGVPRRVAAQLHQPDGDERAVPGRVAPTSRWSGLCHSVYWTVHDCATWSACRSTRSTTGPRRQPPGWVLRFEHGGENLYPRLDAVIAADPQLRRRVRVDMYRRLGYYPTETSEHSSEYVPWYLHHDGEIERLRMPVGRVPAASSRRTSRSTSRPAKALAAGEPLTCESRRTEYAPQVIHSIVTGTPRPSRQRAEPRLIDNLPQGAAVEVPAWSTARACSPSRGRAAAAVRRAQPGVPRRRRAQVRAALDGDPRLVRQAAMVDPNTAATLPVERIWDAVRRHDEAHGDLLPEALRAGVRAWSGPGAGRCSGRVTPGNRSWFTVRGARGSRCR